MPDTPRPSALAQIKLPPDYRQSRQPIFPSDGSLQWYIRQHREALASRGAVLMIRGSLHVHEDKFDSYVVEAGQDEARRKISSLA